MVCVCVCVCVGGGGGARQGDPEWAGGEVGTDDRGIFDFDVVGVVGAGKREEAVNGGGGPMMMWFL